MTDSQDSQDLIMRYFLNQSSAPGNRLAPTNQSTSKYNREQSDNQGSLVHTTDANFSNINQALGRRAKRVFDKNNQFNKYHLYADIHTPSLNFYENMEWWERDSTNDFLKQIDRQK